MDLFQISKNNRCWKIYIDIEEVRNSNLGKVVIGKAGIAARVRMVAGLR